MTTFISSSIYVAFFHEHIAVFQLKHLISKSPGLEIFKMWSTIFYLQNWQIYCKISTKTSLLNHLCFTTSRWHHFDITLTSLWQHFLYGFLWIANDIAPWIVVYLNVSSPCFTLSALFSTVNTTQTLYSLPL